MNTGISTGGRTNAERRGQQRYGAKIRVEKKPVKLVFTADEYAAILEQRTPGEDIKHCIKRLIRQGMNSESA